MATEQPSLPPAIPSMSASAPPPLPPVSTSGPPSIPLGTGDAAQQLSQPPTVPTKMFVRPHEEFEKPAKEALRKFKVPQLLMGIMAWIVGMFVAALININSTMVTLPLLIMAGLWLAFVAHRYSALLPGTFIGNLFSRQGRLGKKLYLVALSPLLIVLSGIMIGGGGDDAVGKLVLGIYMICTVPFAGFTLYQVRETIGSSPQ